MPWVNSSDLVPPLTDAERATIASGKAIVRWIRRGSIIVLPRVIHADYGDVTGVGITYGPDGEDAFFYEGARKDPIRCQRSGRPLSECGAHVGTNGVVHCNICTLH